MGRLWAFEIWLARLPKHHSHVSEHCMSGAAIQRRVDANPIFRVQIENLYVEAMVLADEAYACFSAGRDLSGSLVESTQRVALACESIKTSTRLMHVIAWLLHQRALIAREPGATSKDSAAQLGDALEADSELCARFDSHVQRVVRDSERLFERVKRLDHEWRSAPHDAPVQALMQSIAARL